MLPDDLELYLRGEIAVNRTLDRLMDRIFNNSDPDEAREALKRIANQFPDELPQSLDALVHYRGMRASLNEEDFRWGAIVAMTPAETRKLRAKRLKQYKQYLQLFELEIRLGRALRRDAMALRSNWSTIEQDFFDGAAILRQRVLLRLAGMLYRVGLPGALDYCDAAVFQMFRLVYLRPPSPAA